MGKPVSRKPRRKPAGRPALDDDMTELASVLAEHALERSTHGWFQLPWRDGWNAAYLALDGWYQHSNSDEALLLKEIAEHVDHWVAARCISPSIYEQADHDLAVTAAAFFNGDRRRYLSSALRCVQLVISNSHGGGATFNEVLRACFDGCRTDWISNIVLRARCRDAIGVDPFEANDEDDRLRRAFKIAWGRGLFHAAYSLPRAKKAIY